MGKREEVVTNIIWRFSERVLAQLVAFAVSVVLARILDPSVYGTVALITVITTILQVFVDSGLGNALIQKKEVDNTDFSSVFLVNIFFCALLYLLLFLSAPLIASFYEDMSMAPYIRVLGLTVLISGVKNVQQAYVARHMMFRKFFFSTLGGTIVAGIVGIVMALKGYGVWSLISQHVINLTIDTLILWLIVDWRPQLCFSFDRIKVLFGYGWKLLVSALLDTGYRNSRQLIIGKIYSPSDLAFYDQGEKMPTLIANNINVSIDSVLLPVLSREQNDKDRVRAMTRKSIKVGTYVMAPIMLGLVFVAEPLISLLLKDKWLPAVFFLRIFCITFIFYPLHTVNLNAIKALGRSDLFLYLEIIKKAIGIVCILCTMWISVKAMALSLLVASLLSQIINSWPNGKLLNYPYIRQLLDITPSLLISLVMGITVYCINLLGLSSIPTLVLQIVIGATTYILLSYLFKLEEFHYLLNMLKSRRLI